MLQQFEIAELGEEHITIDGEEYFAVKGKHSIWVPKPMLKIIWSHSGRIESYQDWDKGKNAEAIRAGTLNEHGGFGEEDLRSIANEYVLMDLLAAQEMAPTVGGLFYIRNMVSDMPYGARWHDPLGCWGYYVKPAEIMPEAGRFGEAAFKEAFLDTGLVEASAGALGDILKNGNIINGYLIDVRRTAWDNMRLSSSQEVDRLSKDLLRATSPDLDGLKEKVVAKGQFPYNQRKQAYQSYFLAGDYCEGSRDTQYRFDQMGIEQDLSGKTVLDLGCCFGAVATEAYRRGARKITGVDAVGDYIECARDLARANSFPINFLEYNLSRGEDFVTYIRELYEAPISIVFALSLYKHIRSDLWTILNNIEWEVCYLESNNAPEGLGTGHVKEMLAGMQTLSHSEIVCLGKTEDRSPRIIWKVIR